MSLWAGTYSRLPHGYFADARILEAGDQAAALLLRMSSFADENSTDGRLTDRQVSHLGSRRGRAASLERLRAVGLVSRIDVPSGWEITGWLDGHRTAARKAEIARSRRSAGREGGRRSPKQPPAPAPDPQANSKQFASDLLAIEQRRVEQSRATTTTTARETNEAPWQTTGDAVADLLALVDEGARSAAALVVRRGLTRGWSSSGLIELASRATLKTDPPAWWIATVDKADVATTDPYASEAL